MVKNVTALPNNVKTHAPSLSTGSVDGDLLNTIGNANALNDEKIRIIRN